MKKLERFAAACLSAVMLFSSAVFAETAEPAAEIPKAVDSPFKDVDVDTETGKAILKLYNAGVIAGYEDETFRPDGNITRAELVRIFNQVFKYSPSEEALAGVKDFADNEDPEAWYYNDVRIAQVAGYINGFEDNTFRGKENFTRQQACVVIDLITGVNTADNEIVISDEVSEWAVNYVNWALAAGLFKLEENNTFRATQNITRAEVCNLLEIFVPEKSEEGNEPETEEGTTQEVTVKTSNGTVVKVTKGGGGSSGSGSSSKSTTKAAVTTSESTTETTTSTKESSTETTTSEKSTKTTKTTKTTTTTTKSTTTTTKTTTTTTKETSTETTTLDLDPANVEPDEEIMSRLQSVYDALQRYVIPNCSSGDQQDVALQIANAIANYIDDHSYDIGSDAKSAVSAFKRLPSDEKKELRNLIIEYVGLEDLLILQQTYFPGLIYEM